MTAQIAKWHCGGPDKGEEQSRDLSENHVLRFDPTQVNAERVVVCWLKGDNFTFATPNPRSGGGAWNLQFREEIWVATLDDAARMRRS